MIHADVESVNAHAAQPKNVEERVKALLEGVLGQVEALVKERGSLADFEEMLGDFKACASRLAKSAASGKAEPAPKPAFTASGEIPVAQPVENHHRARAESSTHSHPQAHSQSHKK
jgi:hypothetical protein